jgi:hypothetical protein
MNAAALTAAGCATAITDAAALAEVAASLVKGRNHVIDGGSQTSPLTGTPGANIQLKSFGPHPGKDDGPPLGDLSG